MIKVSHHTPVDSNKATTSIDKRGGGSEIAQKVSRIILIWKEKQYFQMVAVFFKTF